MGRLTRVAGGAAVALLTFAGAAVPAGAAADQERPFSGTVSGEATFPFVAPSVCPGGMQTVTTAEGRLSHLGASSMTAAHCTPAGAEITDGAMTFTAANGDELHVAYDGQALDAPDVLGGTVPLGGTIPIVGTFQVTGGTGRFADATGGGTYVSGVVFEGLADPTWAGTWTYTGTIDY